MAARLIGLAAMCLCLLPSLQASAAVVDDTRARQLISGHVDANAPGTGLAAALISPSGIRTFFYGTTGNPQHPNIDEHTIFETGSISKTFTAALLLDMANRGEVRLDTPFQDLLPPEVKLGRQQPRPVVLEDLITHHSGLPEFPNGKAVKASKASNPDNPFAAYRPDDLWGWFHERDIKGVGKRFDYSNLAYGALGLGLSRRLKTSYEDALSTRILTPLKMHETFITVPAASQVRVAQPHGRKAKPVPALYIPAFEGAGAVRSSLADMIIWVRANMTHQGPLTSALHAPRAEAGGGLKVGLSWIVSEKDGQRIVWHNGSTNGSSSFTGFIAQSGEAVVVLTNSVVEPDELAVKLLGVVP